MDAQWVTPRIMVGAALTVVDLQALVADGITHICDVTQHDDDDFLTVATSHPSINCLWINTGDDGQDKSDLFKPVAAWFLGAWLDPRSKFIFHCDAGFNRGPSACYLGLRLLDWLGTSAEAGIRTVRPVGLRYMADAERCLVKLGYA